MKALICVAVIALTLFHFWASHKSTRRWYLGGIVPLIWAGTLAFLFARGSIVLGRDWAMLVFPMLLLLLIWAKGQHAARRRENNRMKARDIA